MPDLSLAILYVDDPAASAAFYADLLGQPLVHLGLIILATERGLCCRNIGSSGR